MSGPYNSGQYNYGHYSAEDIAFGLWTPETPCLSIWTDDACTGATPLPPTRNYLLNEDGTPILTEDGQPILVE